MVGKPLGFVVFVGVLVLGLEAGSAVISVLPIGIFLLGYILFSTGVIQRVVYVSMSLAGNTIAIPYMVSIGNYGSLAQVLVTIFISMIFLYRYHRVEVEV
ncbi:membrane hypothetical protein [Vibrio chagasii]|nr:membrane hypothetical protein [Vibrio chagasii]